MRTRSKRYCHPTLFPWFLLMCSIEMGNQHGSATFFIRLWNSLSLQSIDCGIFTQERNTPRSLQPRHMNVMAFHITGKSTFIQELVQTNNKGNIKAPHYHYWPFVRSTGHCCEGNPPVTIVRGIHRSPLWGESTCPKFPFHDALLRMELNQAYRRFVVEIQLELYEYAEQLLWISHFSFP